MRFHLSVEPLEARVLMSRAAAAGVGDSFNLTSSAPDEVLSAPGRTKDLKPTVGPTVGPLAGAAPLSDPNPFYGPLAGFDISTDSGEKPQSKIWTHDGSWFGVFAQGTGTWVLRLDGNSWTPILQLSSSDYHADTTCVGDVTHVLLYGGTSSRVASIEYVPGSPGTYTWWSARAPNSLTSVTLDSGVETAAMDVDGDGRMWVVNAGTTSVYARWSDAPYTSFSSPITIASGVDDDDIADVVAFPDGAVGILWSNQDDEVFGFKKHAAGASASSWVEETVPDEGSDFADDHINLVVSRDGTMFAAIKTSKTSGMLIGLLVRNPDGTWEDPINLATSGTRPIVAVNDLDDTVTVFYSSSTSGGSIRYRRASRSNMSFSSAATAISGSSLNNSSGTKQALRTRGDIVVVAADDSEELSGVRWRPPLRGDLNLDNDVDDDDLSTLGSFYGKASGAWWWEGDVDDDGDVDLADLTRLSTYLGTSV
jgi:hypothetical protein